MNGDSRSEYESFLSRATKEAGFTFFGRVFALAFGFAAQAILARLLGADLLGVYVLAWTVVMAVTILTTFGFEGGFVRFIAMYVAQDRRDRARAVLSFGILFGTLAALAATAIVILLRRPIAIGFFKEPRLEPALLWMSLAILPYTLTRLYAAALRALKDMRRSIIGSEFWFRIPRLLIFLALFYAGMRLNGIVAAAVFACVLSAVATARYLRGSGPFLFGRGGRSSPDGISRREVLSYSGQMLSETVTAFALLEGGRLILGYFLESASVGIYNIVVLLAMLATLFTFSFNAIFSPMIADVYHRGKRDLMVSLLVTITRWILLLTLPAYAWLLLSGEAVLGIFGPEFVAGYAALAVLATAQLVESSAGSVASCLAMTKYQRFNVANTVVMAIVSVTMNVILIPRMGIVGAGIATGASIALVNVARLIEGRVLLGVFPYDRSTLKVLATGAVLLVLVYVVRRYWGAPDRWYWAAVSLVACYAVAGGLTFLMGTSDEDRMVLSSVLRKVLKRGDSG